MGTYGKYSQPDKTPFYPCGLNIFSPEKKKHLHLDGRELCSSLAEAVRSYTIKAGAVFDQLGNTIPLRLNSKRV